MKVMAKLLERGKKNLLLVAYLTSVLSPPPCPHLADVQGHYKSVLFPSLSPTSSYYCEAFTPSTSRSPMTRMEQSKSLYYFEENQ